MRQQAHSPRSDDEQHYLESLRGRFEGDGFRFTVAPEVGTLPDFLDGYVPDALAQKPGRNVAIEVRRAPGSTTGRSLETIRRLFEGHPDWRLQVSFMGREMEARTALAAPHPTRVQAGLDEVRELATSGHGRAAFLLAWSLLEAALRARLGADEDAGRGPSTLVQTLAMQGYIEPETERAVRGLIDLRNRVVHGDLAADPAAADVEQVLAAVAETLRPDAD